MRVLELEDQCSLISLWGGYCPLAEITFLQPIKIRFRPGHHRAIQTRCPLGSFRGPHKNYCVSNIYQISEVDDARVATRLFSGTSDDLSVVDVRVHGCTALQKPVRYNLDRARG